MQLKKIEFRNFRQFYGQQSITFSVDVDQNVTVIHGANGSGKTTILNAFLWLFYDEVDLPKPDQVASERAMAEAGPNGTVDIEVKLSFTHEDVEYTAIRSKTVRRNHSGDFSGKEVSSDLHVEFVDETGNRKIRGNASKSLRQIMPKRLREIFFFDGETIDDLSAIEEQEKIQTAIQNIMGLTILERSTRHLGAVRKRFEDDVSEHGSTELTNLYQKRNELKDNQDSLEQEVGDTRHSQEEAQEELEKVEQRLSQLEESKELQDEREQLESAVEELKTERNSINNNIASRISDAGYVPLAAPALEDTAQMLKDKRDKGEIPSEIKTQFVEDLLNMGECICGRELVPGTQSYQEVRTWREAAGSSELEEAAMNIASRLTEIGEEEDLIFRDINEFLSERSSVGNQMRKKKERISEISSQLEEIDTENISDLESRRQELDEQISDYDQQIGAIELKIEETDSEIEEVTAEINDVKKENKKAEIAKRRAQTAEYLEARIENLFNEYQNEVRKSVNDRVNEIFQNIIVKEYYAEIDENYSLRILKDIGSEETTIVAKSTGERQVASLSFIASLISLARDRYQSDEESIYFSGGIYPIIMDSPFGYLDPEYQERVSSVLPEMAEQVVVMVTQSQWTPEVAGEISSIAGNRYYLEYHDPSKEPSVDYDYTEIVAKGGGGQ